MKKILILIYIFFCMDELQAEIPFSQLKSLTEMMKPMTFDSHIGGKVSQGDTQGRENIFSPVNGFLALKTGTLERIRFFGNYGKMYKKYSHDGVHLLPSESRVPVVGGFPLHPEWQHPAFKVSLLKQPTSVTIDDPHAFSKQFEYPLDPISALVQWLFPSVDGAIFVANDRSNDLVGKMGLMMKRKFEYQQKLTEKANMKEEYEKFSLLLRNAKSQQERKNISKSPIVEKYRKLLRDISVLKGQLDSFKTNPFSEILKTIHQCTHQTCTQEQFSGLITQSLPKVSVTPRKKSQALIFSEILYSALVQDGTFRTDHDRLYPKHIALHSLLAYLWRILDSKNQLIDVMKEAGLMHETAAPHNMERLFLREDYRHQQYSYTKEDYATLSHTLRSGKRLLPLEEMAYTGYGYEVYEKDYPEIIPFASARAPDSHGMIGEAYPDCGETALRNFFNLIVFKEAGEFDVSLLDSLGDHPKIEAIRSFYKTFPNISLQLSQKARNAWSEIVSDLNGKPNSLNSSDPMDVRYDGYSNIKASLGIKNILNVMAKLTGDEVLNQPWMMENQSAQTAEKLSRLCEILSRREAFKLNWTINHQSETAPSYGSFNFTLTKPKGKLAFIFDITHTHFNLKYTSDSQSDWRKKDIALNPPLKDHLLASFYRKKPPPFLNPSIRENQNRTLTFWRSLSKDQSIILNLRFLYKMFGAQAEDIYTQVQIMRGLNPLRQLEELKSEDQLIQDFAQTLLVSQKDKDKAQIFAWEFGIVSEINTTILGVTKTDQLFSAIQYGLYKTCKYLVDNGADKNAPKVRSQTTPLLEAVKYGHLDIFKYFVRNRAKDIVSGINPLLQAADFGHLDIVTYLVEGGADKEAKNIHDNTPLIYSARSGHLDIVTYLVEKGANKDARDNLGSTSLMHAAMNLSWDIVKYLVEQGADINAGNEFGETPLTVVSKEGHWDIVKYFVEKGANKNDRDNLGVTPLMYAAKSGRLNIVTYLLEKSVDKEIRNNDGETALMYAIEYSHFDIVKYLVEQGANKDATNNFGSTPLMYASKSGRLDIVTYLLEQGADKEIRNNHGETALMCAVKYNHLDIVTYLVEKGVNKDARNNLGETALIYAVKYNYLDIVKYLVGKGANKDARNNFGSTPLMYAKVHSMRQQDVVTYLMEQGAKEDPKDISGESPLIDAAKSGRLDIIQYLVEKGVGIDAKDDSGATPLMYAAQKGHFDIVKYLVERKANINASDHLQDSPLMYVLGLGASLDLNTIQYLVKQGADKNVKNGRGDTPLMYAVSANRLDIVQYFVKQGVDKDARDVNQNTALVLAKRNNYTNIASYLVEQGAKEEAVDPRTQRTRMMTVPTGFALKKRPL